LQAQGYDPNQAFIKRVIGTTGDIIEVKDGQVYRNQAPLQENYILENPRYRLPPLQVPPGHLFVMGDNRNNSNDSHIWGFLPQDHVIGQAIFRFYPLTRLGALNNRETLTEALGSP
ncbi:MAG: signal peptidase I, partial [Microcystaceae cyanobacterium]